MNNSRSYILIIVAVIIVGVIYFINSNSVERGSTQEAVTVLVRNDSSTEELIEEKNISNNFLSQEEKSRRYKLAKEITTPDGFINTDGKPITIGELIGKKVILVDFWTYSCINCQRTTPYLNSWYEKYGDKGFVIIGMHTPEFEFEKDYDNVKAAVEKFGIKFPVVLDNDYSTWTAYKNHYWPRKYLIDIDGYIVYDHIGEGQYEETEKKIQEALSERLAVLGEEGSLDQPLTKEMAISSGTRSPETYFGSARNDEQDKFLLPFGAWNITSEFAQNKAPNASVVFTYTAQNVFFVAEADNEVTMEVLLDDMPLRTEAGTDVVRTPDGKTIVKIKEPRLYKIIQSNQSESHTLKFIIQKEGLRAYTFTFG